MGQGRCRRLWLRTKAFDAHDPHQALDPFAVDDDASTPQDLHHHALAVLGAGEVELVDLENEGQALLALLDAALVVVGRASERDRGVGTGPRRRVLSPGRSSGV